MGKLFDRLTHKLEVRCRPYCAALVAAAGSSERMGGTDKLTAMLGGVPVLVRTLTALDRPRFQLDTASSTTRAAASARAARKTMNATIHGRKRAVSSRSSGRSRDRRQGHHDSTRMVRPPSASC